MQKQQFPTILLPETWQEKLIVWLRQWWLRNVICEHQYYIQKIELKPPSELLGTREHYVETWKCMYCGQLYHRTYDSHPR